jgi:hypothetical protein
MHVLQKAAMMFATKKGIHETVDEKMEWFEGFEMEKKFVDFAGNY